MNYVKRNRDAAYEFDLLQMENKLRSMVLSLLEKPVNLMRDQHDSLEILKDVGRKN